MGKSENIPDNGAVKINNADPRVERVIAVQIVTMLIAVISMLIDGIMTGAFLGDNAMAAYGLTNPVNMFLVALGGLIASGAQVLGGRSAGVKDEEGLNRVLTTSVAAGFTGGLAVSVAILMFIRPLCVALGADMQPIEDLTAQYLTGIAFCMPALVIAQIMPTFLQMRNCRRQLLAAALTQIASDVILDYLNVTVFRGGLWGMAMATVVSCYLYVLMLLLPAYTKAGYKFSLSYYSPEVLGLIVHYGLLYLVYKISTALMILFLNRELSSRGGVDFLAANAIIFSIELIIGAVPSGFGSSTSMLTGYYKGKYGEAAAKTMCRKIVRLSVIVNVIVIAAVLLFADPLVMQFGPESDAVKDLAVWGLRLYVLAVTPNTVNYIIRNYEQNMDHTRSAYLICIGNHLVLPLAAGVVLAAAAPLKYIWLCFVIGHTLCLIISRRVLRKEETEEI